MFTLTFSMVASKRHVCLESFGHKNQKTPSQRRHRTALNAPWVRRNGRTEVSKQKISLTCHVLQTLAVVAYAAFMSGSASYVFICPLFFLSIIFYGASLSFLTLVHPVLCLIVMARRMVKNQKKKEVIMHLALSATLASTWWIMLKSGWVLSV